MAQAYGKHEARAMGSATRHTATEEVRTPEVVMMVGSQSQVRGVVGNRKNPFKNHEPRMNNWRVGKLSGLGGFLVDLVNTISSTIVRNLTVHN